MILKFLITLLFYSATVQARCSESDQIECGTSDRCTRIQYVCDGDNDCGDYTDEQSSLCSAWRNDECARGEFSCRRHGYENCISIKDYCEAADPPCEGNLDRRLCVIVRNEKLQPLEEIVLFSDRMGPGGANLTSNLEMTETKGEDFAHMVDHTLKHDKCPQLYTRVGDNCLSFFFFGNVSWGEGRSFCQTIGGDLFTPSSNAEYLNLVHHIRENELTSDFWIGGNFQNETLGWRWVNGHPIELKTPHWTIRHIPTCQSRTIHIDYRNATLEANDGTCYSYSQAPEELRYGDCVAMTYEMFFFLSDEDCLSKKSPLCKLTTASSSA